MAINPASSLTPGALPTTSLETKQKTTQPGDVPYSRSRVSSQDPNAVPVHPRYIGGANFYEAPRAPARTSINSPQIPGHPTAGNSSVKLDPNGNPTHLVGRQSNGQPFVLQKVQREASAEIQPQAAIADEAGKPKRAGSPSPHVVGADDSAGEHDVNLDPQGNPTHLIFSGSNGVEVARKV